MIERKMIPSKYTQEELNKIWKTILEGGFVPDGQDGLVVPVKVHADSTAEVMTIPNEDRFSRDAFVRRPGSAWMQF